MKYDVDWAAECGDLKCRFEDLDRLSIAARDQPFVDCNESYIWDDTEFSEIFATEYQLICSPEKIAMLVIASAIECVHFGLNHVC